MKKVLFLLSIVFLLSGCVIQEYRPYPGGYYNYSPYYSHPWRGRYGFYGHAPIRRW